MKAGRWVPASYPNWVSFPTPRVGIFSYSQKTFLGYKLKYNLRYKSENRVVKDR